MSKFDPAESGHLPSQCQDNLKPYKDAPFSPESFVELSVAPQRLVRSNERKVSQSNPEGESFVLRTRV